MKEVLEIYGSKSVIMLLTAWMRQNYAFKRINAFPIGSYVYWTIVFLVDTEIV